MGASVELELCLGAEWLRCKTRGVEKRRSDAAVLRNAMVT